MNVRSPRVGFGTVGLAPCWLQRMLAVSVVATRLGVLLSLPNAFGKPGLQLASSSPHQPCSDTTPKGKLGEEAPRVENSRRHDEIMFGSRQA